MSTISIVFPSFHKGNTLARGSRLVLAVATLSALLLGSKPGGVSAGLSHGKTPCIQQGGSDAVRDARGRRLQPQWNPDRHAPALAFHTHPSLQLLGVTDQSTDPPFRYSSRCPKRDLRDRSRCYNQWQHSCHHRSGESSATRGALWPPQPVHVRLHIRACSTKVERSLCNLGMFKTSHECERCRWLAQQRRLSADAAARAADSRG